MRLDIKVPAVGESVQEAVLAQWFRRDGERVQKDEILFLLETDKVTLEIVAEADGILHILEPQGKTLAIGAVIGFLESEAAPADAPEPAVVAAKPIAEAAPPPPSIAVADASAGEMAASPAIAEIETMESPPPMLSPSVRRLVATTGLDPRSASGHRSRRSHHQRRCLAPFGAARRCRKRCRTAITLACRHPSTGNRRSPSLHVPGCIHFTCGFHRASGYAHGRDHPGGRGHPCMRAGRTSHPPAHEPHPAADCRATAGSSAADGHAHHLQ